MKSIISKGKDVDEAINLGLQLMETSSDEVKIEVLDTGNKGLMGLFGKGAVVRLTKTIEKNISEIDHSLHDEEISVKLEELELEEKADIDDLTGKVWVKDGEIFCRTSEGNYPSLTIPKHITVVTDGNVLQEKFLTLSQEESYELISADVLEDTYWEITMNAKKTAAHLTIEPGYKSNFTVLDAEATQHLELSVAENKEIHNTLTIDDVIGKLNSLGIINGINHNEIVKATESEEAGLFIIAEGKEPKEGKNGWFEAKVNTEIQEGLKEKEDGRVDYREIKKIPNIEKGELLGIIHQPTSGVTGNTVTNIPILVKQTFPLEIRTGNEVAIIDNKIIANASGRPNIERKGLLLSVSIAPKLVHTGNVDLNSGNITFKGDVEVLGEVTNQMSIEASGTIEVHKTVNHSVLKSSRGVILHSNSIGSEVLTGIISTVEVERINQLKSISEKVNKLLLLVESLMGSESYQGGKYKVSSIQSLIWKLVEKKFPEIPRQVKDFSNSISEVEATIENEVWRKIANSLSKLFLTLSTEAVTFENVQQLSVKMTTLVEENSKSSDEDVFITTPNAMNSTLYSSGDISVTGRGCINTEIQAAGNVFISGIVRGGEIYGGLGVTIGQAGSNSSSSTVISVPNDKVIRIDKALEGVILKIGNEVYKFTKPVANVHAYLDRNNKIIVESRLN